MSTIKSLLISRLLFSNLSFLFHNVLVCRNKNVKSVKVVKGTIRSKNTIGLGYGIIRIIHSSLDLNFDPDCITCWCIITY